mmetsp:Transcript_5262/g.11137  ORF Transcript_5262/g.11137 Transcript_5262/m.11137 type:complete len:225 (-) Transcript_5262:125-799(-)
MRIFLQHAIYPFSFRYQSEVVFHDSVSVRKTFLAHFPGVTARIPIQICPLHTSDISFLVGITNIVFASIPWKSHSTLRTLLTLTLPRCESTTDALVLRSSLLVLASICPCPLIKDTIFVLHATLAVWTAILVDCSGVHSKIAKLIRIGHLLYATNLSFILKSCRDPPVHFALGLLTAVISSLFSVVSYFIFQPFFVVTARFCFFFDRNNGVEEFLLRWWLGMQR